MLVATGRSEAGGRHECLMDSMGSIGFIYPDVVPPLIFRKVHGVVGMFHQYQFVVAVIRENCDTDTA